MLELDQCLRRLVTQPHLLEGPANHLVVAESARLPARRCRQEALADGTVDDRQHLIDVFAGGVVDRYLDDFVLAALGAAQERAY